eukprot:7844487-Heterocapsa_arctica.AAC.1
MATHGHREDQQGTTTSAATGTSRTAAVAALRGSARCPGKTSRKEAARDTGAPRRPRRTTRPTSSGNGTSRTMTTATGTGTASRTGLGTKGASPPRSSAMRSPSWNST